MASIRDVAAAAGVSVGTVSMVLNNSNKVSAATQTVVREAIRQLGYRRNPFARSLSLNRSHTIGLVVTDLTNPFFGLLVGHLQRVLNELNYGLMLGMSENSAELEERITQNLIDSGVDGLLIVPAHERDVRATHCEAIEQSKVPVVYLTAYYPGYEKNCVMTDLESGSYQVARHLLKTGHDCVCMISGYRGVIASEMRVSGFLRAHREKGLEVQPWQIVESEPVFEGGYGAARILLEKHRPDAIMTINDVLSMGVLSYLHQAGISVPADISVAGYDDLAFSEMLQTPLTTVRQPLQEMCAVAARLLISLINGAPGAAKPIMISPEIILRASTMERGVHASGPTLVINPSP